jgi:hypothetical protein
MDIKKGGRWTMDKRQTKRLKKKKKEKEKRKTKITLMDMNRQAEIRGTDQQIREAKFD